MSKSLPSSSMVCMLNMLHCKVWQKMLAEWACRGCEHTWIIYIYTCNYMYIHYCNYIIYIYIFIYDCWSNFLTVFGSARQDTPGYRETRATVRPAPNLSCCHPRPAHNLLELGLVQNHISQPFSNRAGEETGV